MIKTKINPLVSIILRTKNEERWITKCLKKIFEQSYKNFEIIIVDNNSTDNTLKRAQKYNIKSIIKIDKFYPGKAINLGISKSKGDLLVILSSHCIPVNNKWLSFLVSTILENEKYAGVYGRQEPMVFTEDNDKRDMLLLFGLDKKIQIKDTFFHNANSIIRKKVWKKFPFNSKITNIEDRLWGEKVIKKGYKIVYEPLASVYHYHGVHQNNNKARLDNVVKIVNNNINQGTIDPKKLNIYAILPIRGESVKIGNKHLIEFTLRDLKKSQFINKIIVSSDNKKTANIAKKLGAYVPFIRPKKLSNSDISLEKVQEFTLKELEKLGHDIDLIIHCEETFPFRNKNIFDDLIVKVLSGGFDSVIASKRENNWLWSEKNKNFFQRIDRGDIPREFKEKCMIGYHGLGCISYPEFIRKGSLLGKKIGLLEINNPLSFFEVRSEISLNIAKKIIPTFFNEKKV